MISLIFIGLLTSKASAIDFHAFGNIRAAKNSLDERDTEYSSTENHFNVTSLSRLGLNASSSPDEKTNLMGQVLFEGTNDILLDLLHVKRDVDHGMFVKVGKQRLPWLLYSEHVQVDALLPWTTRPDEVYGKVPFQSFTGLSVEKQWKQFNLTGFVGENKEVITTQNTGAKYAVHINDLYGARVEFQSNNKLKIYSSYSRFNGEVDVSTQIDGTTAGTRIGYEFSDDLERYELKTLGFQANFGNSFFISEHLNGKSQSKMLKKTESAYAALGHTFAEKFQPIIQVSSDLKVDSELFPSKTTTYAAGVLYHYSESSVIKIGFSHVDFRLVTVDSSLTPPSSNLAFLSSGSIDEDFDVYNFQWAFIF